MTELRISERDVRGVLVEAACIEGGDLYDFEEKLCPPQSGWARVVGPGASFVTGEWLNPFELRAAYYIVGRAHWYTFWKPLSFSFWVRGGSDWWFRETGERAKIDARGHDHTTQAFKDLGLGDLLH